MLSPPSPPRSPWNPARVLAYTPFHEQTDEEDDGGEEDEDEDDNWGPVQRCRRKVAIMVYSKWWSRVVLMIILLNVGFMLLEAEFMEIRDWTQSHHYFDDCFLAFFIVEISLRIFVDGLGGFFCHSDHEEQRWNWSDFCIVTLGILAVFVRPWNEWKSPWDQNWNEISYQKDNWSKVFLQLRVLRIVRVIRVFKRLRQLHMLIRGMFKSFEAVFWILVLGLLIVMFFAVAATNVVGQHYHLWELCTEGPGRPLHCCRLCEEGDVDRIQLLFGDLGQSMWTMFQFVTLDEWAGIIALVSKRMWFMKYFFLLYTLIASFALISLLTGVMAEHIMSESQQTKEVEGDEDLREYINSLKRSFWRRARPSNTSQGGGYLTFHDLERLIEDKEVQSTLRDAGLEHVFNPEDLKDSFAAMDLDGSGTLSWAEFLRGLKTITGAASARELSLARKDVKRVLKQMNNDSGKKTEDPSVLDRLRTMEDRLTRLEASQRDGMARVESTLRTFVRAHQASLSPISATPVQYQTPRVPP